MLLHLMNENSLKGQPNREGLHLIPEAGGTTADLGGPKFVGQSSNNTERSERRRAFERGKHSNQKIEEKEAKKAIRRKMGI